MLGFKSSCWLHRNRGRRWDYYKRAKRKNKGKNMHVSLCQVCIIKSKSSFFSDQNSYSRNLLQNRPHHENQRNFCLYYLGNLSQMKELVMGFQLVLVLSIINGSCINIQELVKVVVFSIQINSKKLYIFSLHLSYISILWYAIIYKYIYVYSVYIFRCIYI